MRSPVPADLAMLGQDPRLGGGALAEMAAFWQGAAALGRTPTAVLPRLPRSSSTGRCRTIPVESEEMPQSSPGLDAVEPVRRRRRVARRIRGARSDLGRLDDRVARIRRRARSGRRFGCWVATTIGAEAASRALRLGGARGVALRDERAGARQAGTARATRSVRVRDRVSRNAARDRRRRLHRRVAGSRSSDPRRRRPVHPAADRDWEESLEPAAAALRRPRVRSAQERRRCS